MRENNPLIQVSMQIILHAGDAHNNAVEALNIAENGKISEAEAKLKEAEVNITKAHEAQTKVIQEEMSGTNYEPCLLFNHAQDTLMTTVTELRMAERIVKLYKKLNNQ